MTEPGFRFHDETTDSTPMPSDRHVTVDWADPDRVVDVENMLCERYSRMLSGSARKVAHFGSWPDNARILAHFRIPALT